MKRLEVKFYDSKFVQGWGGDTEDDLPVITVIGYLKSESDRHLTLVMAYSDLGLKFVNFTIPKSSISSRKEVRIK